MLCNALAQNPEPFSYNTEISPSVETYTVTKYGGVTPSLYTGAMSYSHPLHTYRDEDFEIPISLEYHFDGYRPSTHSGSIGYGWALQYGGVITREVFGFPDDLNGSDCEDRFEGYYESIRDGVFSQHSGNYELASGTIAGSELCGEGAGQRSYINVFADSPVYRESWSSVGYGSKHYDPNPDLFNFNFLGYSGSFMLNSDGSVEVFNCSCPKGEVSVEYDFLKRGVLPESEIIITTGNGYRYTFGGDYTAMEYSIPLSADSHVSVSAWRLRRIEAPNGNYLEFIHDPLLNSELRITYAYTPVINSNAGMEFYRYETTSEIASTINTLSPLLRQIVVNGRTIYEFEATQHNNDENASSCFGDPTKLTNTTTYNSCFCSYPRALKSITVKNYDDEQIDQIMMEHRFVRASSPRMFLNSVISNAGKYSFDYENLSPPYNDTKATDHWGFWNGGPADLYLPDVLSYSFNSLHNQFIPGNTSKESVFAYTKQGALTRINYPTGGHTSIEYEANQAEKMIDRGFGRCPDLCTRSGHPNTIIGGVRVKSISNTADNITRRVTYQYLNDDNSSSGILLKMPLYSFRLSYEMKVNELAGERMSITSTCYTDECGSTLPSDPFITYSRVLEKYPDGSTVEYKFENYDNKADWYDNQLSLCSFPKKTFKHESDFICGQEDDPSYSDAIRKTMLAKYKDFSNCRGKLLYKNEYDNTGTLKRKTCYDYYDVLEHERQMFYNTIIDFTKMPLQIYSSRLLSIHEHAYEDDKEIVTSTTYSYNENGQISKIDQEGDSVELSTHYRYVMEEEGSQVSPSLRSAVADVVQTRSEMGNKYILSNLHYRYGYNGNSQPERIVRYVGAHPMICDEQSSVYIIPDEYKMMTYNYSYDPDKFRLLSASHPGGYVISYIWDPSFRHIITKTVNSDINKYQYEWKDMVGLVKVTMTTAQYHIYQYDNRNRLSEEFDHTGAHINSYRYHLNNE